MRLHFTQGIMYGGKISMFMLLKRYLTIRNNSFYEKLMKSATSQIS